jgi:hypothetical protein
LLKDWVKRKFVFIVIIFSLLTIFVDMKSVYLLHQLTIFSKFITIFFTDHSFDSWLSFKFMLWIFVCGSLQIGRRFSYNTILYVFINIEKICTKIDWILTEKVNEWFWILFGIETNFEKVFQSVPIFNLWVFFSRK